MAEQSEEKAKECSSFRLIYFPFGGRAEAIRNAAAIGGIAFEETVITPDEHKKDKTEGNQRWSGPPQIVILDKDGKDIANIGQSNACLRYIGKLSGLYPKDAVEAALVDEILDSVEDMFAPSVFTILLNPNQDEKNKRAIEFCKEGGPLRYWSDKFLNRLDENAKKGNKNGLFVGDNISIADLKVSTAFGLLSVLLPGSGLKKDEKGALSDDKYKPIKDVMNFVNNNEKIKAFQQEFDKNCAAFKENSENRLFKYKGKCSC